MCMIFWRKTHIDDSWALYTYSLFRLQEVKKSINVNLELLWHAANIRGWVTWDPVQQEGGEPLLEENRGPGEEDLVIIL